MLVRFASKEEAHKLGFITYDDFEVVIAIDRRSKEVLGMLGFSRSDKSIKQIQIFDELNEDRIRKQLNKIAQRQMYPEGRSFHYDYKRFYKRMKKENCPTCNSEPMPPGMEEFASFPNSWVIAEPKAQGKLFGKCVVGSTYHNVHFYDMPEEEMIAFMKDVQKVAKALHKVTGAVKINYEIHGNSGPHLHCHLFPRYLDDDFPSAAINYHLTEPSPYEDEEEYRWFINEMRKELGLCSS